MKKSFIYILLIQLFFCSCNNNSSNGLFSSDLLGNAQAVSLRGDTLFSDPPNEKVLSSYENAKNEYEINKTDPDKVLEAINPDLEVIENMAYHNLCLFYKGELSMDKITGDSFTDIMNDAVLYGIGNWFYYNEQTDKAKEVFERILEKDGWASFGYIAAEADYVRNFAN